jgi:hypothetical protein
MDSSGLLESLKDNHSLTLEGAAMVLRVQRVGSTVVQVRQSNDSDRSQCNEIQPKKNSKAITRTIYLPFPCPTLTPGNVTLNTQN